LDCFVAGVVAEFVGDEARDTGSDADIYYVFLELGVAGEDGADYYILSLELFLEGCGREVGF
jgi:hypothetical protein